MIGKHIAGWKWLADPNSKEYATAADALSYYTLREAFDVLGLTEAMTPFECYELGWAFGLMDTTPELTEILTEALRTAFENRLPISFGWFEQSRICTLSIGVEGGTMSLLLGTPALDEAKLPSMFSGLSGSLAGTA
jgi:hypothetical protein